MKDGFWNGIMTYACVSSLIQDMFGLDGWVAHIRASWIDAKFTVPLAIIGLLLVLINIANEKRKSRLTDDAADTRKSDVE